MKITRKRLLSLVFITLLLSASVFMFLSLHKEIPAIEDLPALKAIDKVRKAEKFGQTVELNEAEVNSIVKFYAAEVLASQQNIEAVNIKLLDKGIAFFAQASYLNSFRVVLNTKGSLSVKNGTVIYQPQGFWAGSMPLPKNMINLLLSKVADKGITLDQGNLVLGREFIPFHISSLDVGNGKMTIGFKKSVPAPETAEPNSDSSKGDSSSGNNFPAKADNPTAKTETLPKVSDNTKKELLQEVNGQLSVVLSKVKTAGERAIISAILEVVSKMTANPSYPFQNEAQSVKAMYSKLSTEEKTDLKQTMLSNMNMNTLVAVKNVFGL